MLVRGTEDGIVFHAAERVGKLVARPEPTLRRTRASVTVAMLQRITSAVTRSNIRCYRNTMRLMCVGTESSHERPAWSRKNLVFDLLFIKLLD